MNEKKTNTNPQPNEINPNQPFGQMTWKPCTFEVDEEGNLVWQTPADVDCRKPIQMILAWRNSIAAEKVNAIKTERSAISNVKQATIIIQTAEERKKDPNPYYTYGAYTQDMIDPVYVIENMYHNPNTK